MSVLRALLCVLLVIAPALPAAAPLPATHVALLVTGHAHPALPEALARADAAALLDADAAPFFEALRAIVEPAGGRVDATWSAAPAARVVGPVALLHLLDEQPFVAHAQPEAPGEVALIGGDEPGDALEARNTGGRQMIQAEEAWGLGFRGAGTRVAVIGTGIDATHEAFRNADGASRVVAWSDFVSGAPAPYDDHGHSTFMAASAAGSAWYEDPVHGVFEEAGVAPSSSLVIAKFLDANGGGSFSNALSAMQWAFDQDADVAINAWGSACASNALAVMQAVRTLTQAGMTSIFTVGASGPGASTIAAPACGESAISVGAIQASLDIYSPSGRGPCSDIEIGGAPRICPDLVAKGAPVRSAAPRGSCSLCDPSGYRTLSGVGAPTAFVGGGVALIEEMKLAYTGVGWNSSAGEEELILKQTALDLGPVGPDDTYGWGLPQLMGVHAVLAQDPAARVVTTMSAPVGELRGGGTGPLRFVVRNLGTANATGLFEVTLELPDASVITLAARNVTLGLLQSAEYSGTFSVGAHTLPGTYTFRGEFDHSWTNETSGEEERVTILREASFDVRRVRMLVETEGIPSAAAPGDPQRVRVTATNAGNDDARDVVLRFTVPDSYEFVNVDGFDPTRVESRYASPPPSRVVTDSTFGRVTLIFEIGDLAEGTAFTFDTTLLATRLGKHHLLLAGTYCDPVGHCASFGRVIPQEIKLPLP